MFEIHDGDLSKQAYQALQTESLIACDTETSGLNWKTDSLGLVQFFGEQSGAHLVKVRSEVTAVRICQLIESRSTRKVFHHAPFDLAFMTATWGANARNCVCTKIASKILWAGEEAEHSLQALLMRVLGVQLNKGTVRTSNWLDQNLSPEQLAYAAKDVEHLIPLVRILEKGLASNQKLDLYLECCAFLPTRAKLDQLMLNDIFSY
ncbi:ribonuclease D [Glutamicibacter sp. HZAU]|uniref:ribonuclease D n=1 Tax=Glutamicibacter sp. HZAU TaxID=2049891 RepID=UPI000FFCB3FD|nr:ribonuclease D [Glutamicibacter sp. HZAU]RWZ83238.1 ribonuclease D [Glutamicibacter sp. HZAU]